MFTKHIKQIFNNDFDVFCMIGLKINNGKPNVFIVGAKLPSEKIEIGAHGKACPVCGAVMSWAYDRYFCRRCQYDPAGQDEP